MAFEKITLLERQALIFEIIESLSVSDVERISTEVQKSLESNKLSYFVLDLKSLMIPFETLRPLTVLGSHLKSVGKKLCALSERQSVINLISREGLSQVIFAISDIQELAGPPTKGRIKSSIDVDFINPFIEGVLHVLKVQCQIEVSPGKPFLKVSDSPSQGVDIAGVIGITNPNFKGSISVCFSTKAFLYLMSKTFGEEFTEITKELEDGAGEILNMVFGHAKRILNERNFGLDRALPTVVRGMDITLNQLSDQNTIILPFKAAELSFHMEICTEIANKE